MQSFAGRDIETASLYGNRIQFVASNDRIRERVQNLSHEAHILDKIVEVSDESACLWDVGACFGIHSFVASSFYDRVVSFEPMPSNRGALVDNMGVNGFKNIFVCIEALSDQFGRTEFAIRQSNEAGYGRHSLDTGDYDKLDSITVKQAKGDQMTGFGFPNVIKIDVEGAEGLVLDGLTDTLRDKRCHHVILETHEPNPIQPSYADYGYTEDDLWSMIEAAGFTVETLNKDYHLYGYKT